MKMKLLLLFAVMHLIALSVKSTNEEGDFVRFVIPPKKHLDSDGNTSNKHHRRIREAETCKIPDEMETAELNCTSYPRYNKCIQTCIFGYAVTEGLQRKMKCMHDENIWKPTETFEECKPYVDCEIDMLGGGIAKCYTNFMDTAPYCDISCPLHYEDKDPLPTIERYVCDINGTWTPKLPFCAVPKGIELISPQSLQKWTTKSPKQSPSPSAIKHSPSPSTTKESPSPSTTKQAPSTPELPKQMPHLQKRPRKMPVRQKSPRKMSLPRT